MNLQESAYLLWQDCLNTLNDLLPKAQKTEGYDAVGFKNPDDCSMYEEIIYLDNSWVLLDGDRQIYSIYCMGLDDFCVMVDAIETIQQKLKTYNVTLYYHTNIGVRVKAENEAEALELAEAEAEKECYIQDILANLIKDGAPDVQEDKNE